MAFVTRAAIPQVRYHRSVQRLADAAAAVAKSNGAGSVEPAHLLLALLDAADARVNSAFRALNVDPAAVRRRLAELEPPADSGLVSDGEPAVGRDAEEVLRAAAKEAIHLQHGGVEPLHVLFGLLYAGGGTAHDALHDAGVTLFELRRYVLAERRSPLAPVARPWSLPTAWLGLSPTFVGLVAAMVVTGAVLFAGPSPSMTRPLTLLFVLVGWVVSLCLHEFAHAFVAYLGGDDTVKAAGYLTLDPAKYTHPFLSVVLPVLFLLMGGFGLPGGAVYIRPHLLRGPRWRTAVSAAGPAATGLCALVCALPFAALGDGLRSVGHEAFWAALAFLAFVEVTALFWNLLPIPPLDGFGIVEPLLPPDIVVMARTYSNVIYMLLIFLMVFGGLGALTFGYSYEILEALSVPFDLVVQGMAGARLRGY